ncbi:MAG: relaxase, partial [Oscillospiraceae bacterium]|nr:relaxase [Oscillospiraceae bacterium]
KRIQGEIEDLTSAKNDGYTEYRASQKREKELQTVKANIEKMLRQQEPEIKKNHKAHEQEL